MVTMNRSLIISLLFLTVAACSNTDENYLLSNPGHLQKMLKNCPQSVPGAMSCESLEKTADKLNRLGFELRLDPQKFGQTILSLQESIAKEEKQCSVNGSSPESATSLQQHRQQLKERLAVVRWLLSPGG